MNEKPIKPISWSYKAIRYYHPIQRVVMDIENEPILKSIPHFRNQTADQIANFADGMIFTWNRIRRNARELGDSVDTFSDFPAPEDVTSEGLKALKSEDPTKCDVMSCSRQATFNCTFGVKHRTTAMNNNNLCDKCHDALVNSSKEKVDNGSFHLICHLLTGVS